MSAPPAAPPAAPRGRADLLGFSLLEVMVAVAILGMSLTVILSAQVGLFSSGTYSQRMSVALGLSRCKMGELEEQFLKMGYPEVDTNDEGACCNGELRSDFTCAWKIERVELPQPPPVNLASSADPLTGAAPGGPSGGLSGLGALGALAQAGGTFGSDAGAPLGDAGLDPGQLASGLSGTGNSGLSGMLASGAAAGGVSGLAPMLFSMVYPSVKPMLEASIRKVTVTVRWREGVAQRDIEILQWVTSPSRGGFLSDAIDSSSLPGGAAPGSPTGAGLPGGTGAGAPRTGGGSR